MKNLAIIPARSGSKGLKDKNIKLLNGQPLIFYSINAALKSKIFSNVMVSTDSAEYADISRKLGAEVPFLRSEKNSSDSASSWDMVKEVLLNYKKDGIIFDTICLLQPTSPLRDSEDIKKAYLMLKEKNASAVTSVCEVEHSPLWSFPLNETFSMNEYRSKNLGNCRRQDLQTYYRINGAIYIKKIIYENNDVTLENCNEYAFLMDQTKSVDIDTKLDFLIAESLINSL